MPSGAPKNQPKQKSGRAIANLLPKAFSSFKMAVRETPGQGCQSGSKSSWESRHANTMKCLRFVWITVSDCRKQTAPPDAEKAFSLYVTWKNTPWFLEYFSSLGQGFLWPPFWMRRRPWGRGWAIALPALPLHGPCFGVFILSLSIWTFLKSWQSHGKLAGSIMMPVFSSSSQECTYKSMYTYV